MANTLQRTDLNIAPFFDDYDQSKNFHRVLFRPRTVQARELNQLQTILQDQINRFGRNIFSEGSIVVPGGVSVKEQQDCVTVTISGIFSASEAKQLMSQLYIKAGTNTLQAKIIAYNPADGATPANFAIEYVNTTNSGAGKQFEVGEPCIIFTRDASGVERELAFCTIQGNHKGLYVSALSGVYFIRGHLVETQSQSILASTERVGNVRVGFIVRESIIDEVLDSSLYSNAAGTENFKAPGAARLRFDLELAKKGDLVSDVDFVQLVNFVDGVVQSKVDGSNYALIQEMIAQRTFEESGDYALADFPIRTFEHLKSVTQPQGLYTSAQGGNADKLVYRLGQGVAYVRGFRNEINGFYDIVSDKARDSELINNSVMSSDFGNYIVIKDVKSLPIMDIKRSYRLLDSGSALVGNCSVRAIKRENANELRLYITNVTFTNTNNLGNVKYIDFIDGSNKFVAEISAAVIFNGTKDSYVFRLPYAVVKTMKGENGQSDTSYSVIRSYDVTLNASGVGSINLPSGELFSAVTDYDFFVALTGANTTGDMTTSSVLSVAGSPVGRVLNINWPAQPNKVVRVVTKIIKQNPLPKGKTLRVQTQTVNFTNQTSVKLSRADVISVKQVTDLTSNQDVTQLFKFFSGQRQNWYEVGELIVANNVPLTGSYSVEYEWYEHSTGDYFNVDSYGGIPRETIPMTKETADRQYHSLADCIDFRPVKDGSGNFSGTLGDLIDPSDNVRFDLYQYLPRVDAVYALPDGSFKVEKGRASETPIAPSIPDNAMRLYDVSLPAYTVDASEVLFTRVDNRRYTMRDIGRLEKRIENVEYYTALSALESSAERINVVDPATGTNRFKNGFAADSFTDLKVSDVEDTQWKASLDLVQGRVKATFTENRSGLTPIANSGVVVKSETVSKAYTHKLFIDQPLATTTTNINPYAVFTWAGSARLTPSSDYWISTKWAPDIVRNTTVRGSDETSSLLNVNGDLVWNGAMWRANRWIDLNTREDVTNTGVFRNMVVANADSTTTRRTTTESVLGVETIPYMREVTINAQLDGFRPFSRLYAFFNGVDVTAYVQPSGQTIGQPLYVDETGAVTCNVTIPSTEQLKFNTGRGLLRFTDSATDDRLEMTTDGEAEFESGGQIETRQRTTDVTTIRRASLRVRNSDPIAQTFQVNEFGGCFITKVGIAFATKAQNIPVTLQLRRVTNGLPESQPVTFGVVTLKPISVTTSSDAKSITEFEFSQPIYLEDKQEYAIVLIADTQEYNVYKAVMGQRVIGQNIMVSKQPNIGVFLSSSNSSTWTPHQTEDMMFKLYKAEFDLAQSDITFNTTNNVTRLLGFNPFSGVTGSSVIRVQYVGHALRTGDVTAFSGVDISTLTRFGLVDSDINKSGIVVTSYGVDWFEFEHSSNLIATGSFGGSNVNALLNYSITDLATDINMLILDGTSINWEFRYKTQIGRAFSDWLPLGANAVQSLKVEGVQIVAGDVQVRATLRTNNKNLTPQIDLVGLGLTMFGKIINSDVVNPLYRYVSRSLKFDNPSTQSRIFVSALLPGFSTMKVYYKLLSSGDDSTTTKPWVELAPTKPILNNATAQQEYEYIISGVGSFVGYKLSVVLLGDNPCEAPELSGLMTIALA